MNPQRALLALVLFAVVISRSMACSVPVFRYALERWPPDPYQAVVYHQGALSAEETKIVTFLQSSDANLEVAMVDIDTANETQRTNWEEQESDELPWLFVGYPEEHPLAVELAAGPLEEGFAKDVVDTSVRKDIANQLINGQTAIWVMLESGDKVRNEAVWKLLNEQITELESTLELPMIEEEDIKAGLISVDEDELKIAFSALRLSRENPADEMLVRMMLDTEDDLIDRQEPMVFPIFGRGRVLYGLVGKGISSETIELAANYLTGSCSCQVKADNPGVDLLMAMNWDDNVESSLEPDQEIPELAGIISQPPAADSESTASIVTPPISETNLPPVVATTPTATGNDSRLLWTTLSALVLMLVFVALGSTMFTTNNA
ncbi:MAG: hypothetical protein ACKVHP_00835 [Verrucomicrobiales bacterium]